MPPWSTKVDFSPTGFRNNPEVPSLSSKASWHHGLRGIGPDRVYYGRPHGSMTRSEHPSLASEDSRWPNEVESVPTAYETKTERSSHPRSRAVKAWGPEIFATVLAVGLLIAVFLILRAYHGKNTDTWAGPINLTFLIATLSTISRMALACVVNEVISQSKWVQFTTPQPLHKLELYDQASRGLWAPILLLRKSLMKPYLFTALVVAIASIGMGPFAQQAISIQQYSYIDSKDKARIANTQTLGHMPLASRSTMTRAELTPGSVSPEHEFETSLQNVIISSLLNPLGNDSTIMATCPSGNCTLRLFQDEYGEEFTHKSLGLCSVCEDISSSIEYTRGPVVRTGRTAYGPPHRSFQNETWTVPGANILGHELGYLSPSMASLLYTNISFVEDQIVNPVLPFFSIASSIIRTEAPSLLKVTFISDDRLDAATLKTANDRNPRFWSVNGTKESASATECRLDPCLKTYRAKFEGGLLDETLISSKPLTRYGDYYPVSTTRGADEAISGLPDETSETGSLRYKYRGTSDLMEVRSPCLVDGQVYALGNISSAPGAVTLHRFSVPTNFTSTHLHRDYTAEAFFSATADARVNITAPPQCLYALDISHEWYARTRMLLRRVMHGVCWGPGFKDLCYTWQHSFQPAAFTPGPPGPPGPPDFRQDAGRGALTPFWLTSLASLPNRSHPHIEAHMAAFAESLTRKLRMGGFSAANQLEKRLGDAEWRPKSEDVLGDVWRETTRFVVDWRWLIPSTVLTVLTIGVLIWTVVVGILRGDVVWKSSILPLVFYQDRFIVVEREADTAKTKGSWAEDQDLMSIKEMKSESKRTKVVF